MNLFSAAFIIFIIALLVLYYTIFRKKQWVCLLLFSIAFYAYSGISNLIFMAVTGVSVFVGGIFLTSIIKSEKTKALTEPEERK